VRHALILTAALATTTAANATPFFSTDWESLVASRGPYVMQSALPPPSGTAAFGAAAALWHDAASGDDWAVVGAPFEDSLAGAAYVFHRAAGAADWSTDVRLVASDPSTGSEFGYSVAIDGDTVVIGAPLHSDAFFVGAAYVFVRDVASGSWNPLGGELNGSDQEFGYAVSVRADSLVVSDPGAGKIYPYERSGSTWTASPAIGAPSEMLGPSFGASLWMSDTDLLVGAPTDSHALGNQGSAAVYARSHDSWDLQQILRPEIDTSAMQFFGQSLAKSDRGVFVGSPRTNAGAGAFNIFLYDAFSKSWIQQSKALEPASDTGTPPSPLFGYSLATVGDILVVGTPTRDRAVVYRYRAGTWMHDSNLTGDRGSSFGAFVAAAPGNLAIGAPQAGSKGQGGAYIFIDDRIFADGVE
jgi:FG-GAP repeat